MSKIRIACYINQFFGRIGGEEKADVGFTVAEGPSGPAVIVQNIAGDDACVVATVICGDNYISQNLKEAVSEGVELIKMHEPDLFIAGPAFNAGRYGIACAGIAAAVGKELRIPAVTGMYIENPGVELGRKDCYILKTGINAGEMSKAMHIMTDLGMRLVKGEPVGSAASENYVPRGILKNEKLEQSAARRGLDILMAKIKGGDFTTELKIPEYERVAPAPPVKDIKSARIAVVSDGGLVPKGNPDNFKVSQNTVWSKYGLEEIFNNEFQIAHSGYHPSEVKENLNRLIPKDALDGLLEKGEFGELWPMLYSTSGNTTTVQSSRKVGAEIARDLRDSEITAAIITSTWGTSSRCGATIATEIERLGIPAVQITSMVDVAMMMGVSRLIRGSSVTSPVSDFTLDEETEKQMRFRTVEKALDLLQKEGRANEYLIV